MSSNPVSPGSSLPPPVAAEAQGTFNQLTSWVTDHLSTMFTNISHAQIYPGRVTPITPKDPPNTPPTPWKKVLPEGPFSPIPPQITDVAQRSLDIVKAAMPDSGKGWIRASVGIGVGVFGGGLLWAPALATAVGPQLWSAVSKTPDAHLLRLNVLFLELLNQADPTEKQSPSALYSALEFCLALSQTKNPGFSSTALNTLTFCAKLLYQRIYTSEPHTPFTESDLFFIRNAQQFVESVIQQQQGYLSQAADYGKHYLCQAPAEDLSIARRLLLNIDQDPRNPELARSVTAIAKSLPQTSPYLPLFERLTQDLQENEVHAHSVRLALSAIFCIEEAQTGAARKLTQKMPGIIQAPIHQWMDGARQPNVLGAHRHLRPITPPSPSCSSSTVIRTSVSPAPTGMLGNILSTLTAQAARLGAAPFLYALERGLAALNAREMEFTSQKIELNRLLDAISIRDQHGERLVRAEINWNAVMQTVKGSLDLLNSINITVNGVGFPKIGGPKQDYKTDRENLKNSQALRQARNRINPSAPIDGRSWKERAEDEKGKFVGNTTNFVAFKLFYETVCGLDSNSPRYIELMRDANRQTLIDPSDALQASFFLEIEDKVSFPRRMLAHMGYSLTSYLLSKLFDSLYSNILEDTLEYIQQNKRNGFANLKNMVISSFTGYLTILDGIYSEIAVERPTGSVSKMIVEKLERPILNRGHTTEALYTSFAQELIQKITKNPFWQWVLNSGPFIWLLEKCIGPRNRLIATLIDEGVQSISDSNGYTHALNCVLIEQFEEIFTEITSETSTSSAKQTSGLSNNKKLELQGLVKNMVEILRKANCDTLEELKTNIRGDSWRASFTKEYDNIVAGAAIEGIAEKLSELMNLLLQEEQLHKLICKFTSAINNIYADGQPLLTPDEVANTEKYLVNLINNILDVTVETAVDRKLDSTGSFEKERIDFYVARLRQTTVQFAQTVDEQLCALREGCRASNGDLSLPETKARLKALLDKVSTYVTDCRKENEGIQKSNLSTNNKNSLNEQYYLLAVEVEPLITHLTTLTEASNILSYSERLSDSLKSITSTAGIIASSMEKNFYYQAALEESVLKNARALERLALDHKDVNEIKTLLYSLKQALHLYLGEEQLIRFCETQLREVSHWNAHKPIDIPALRDTVNALQGIDENFKTRLHGFYFGLLNPGPHIQEAIASYKINITSLLKSTHSQREQTKHAAIRLSREIQDTIKTNHLDNPSKIRSIQQEIIGTAFYKATAQIQRLHDKQIKEIPQLPTYPVPQEFFKTFITDFFLNEVEQKVNGLLQFLRRPETYKYGVARHLGMLPYLDYVQRFRDVPIVPAAAPS